MIDIWDQVSSNTMPQLSNLQTMWAGGSQGKQASVCHSWWVEGKNGCSGTPRICWLGHASKSIGIRKLPSMTITCRTTKTLRGSTKRGGVASLRQLIDKGQTMNLTMTPDGPRGPRRTAAPGCVYLSSKLQIPLVCLGFGYDNPWRVSSAWDNFAIPRPFSRARMVARTCLLK